MGERRRYLSILGLNDGASDEDIRKAYKKLALQYHPDKNESDDAKGKFQEISNAYTFLTEGPKGFDGLHHGHANDIRAELFRRMFEEMFFPSFAFRGPRGFPFVFVDSDSDDDYYYFDDDDDDESSSDDGFVFSGYGGGHRTFQNRYPGPKRPTTPQYEPSKKQQRKREKRQRQRERARERKAQTQDEKKRPEQQKSQNKNDGYPSQGEQKSTDNQSGKDSQKSAESQSGGNSQEENQPEAGNGGTCRSETPNLSRPSTPLESQQNPQKLTKKQRKKMEAEQRKRDQEMKEIAAEFLKKQEKEKEKQKEREKKSEQRESEEKENEEVFGWFDTKKKSRKARQREKRRQEAMSTPDPTEAKQDNDGLADAEDGEGEGTASGNDRGANDGIPKSTRSPREPLKNVPEINKSSVKPASRPRDAGSQSSQQRSIRRNGPPSNVKSGRIFVNSTQRTANKNQNQNNAGPPGFRMTGRPLSNKYDILDDFDDLNLNNHDDTSDDDSDSEVEEITSQNIHRQNQSKPLFHAPDKGHNGQQKTSAKGDNPRINTSNNFQSGKSQSSVSQNGRGAGVNQTRGGYHGNQVGGTPNQQGRGVGVRQTRGGYSGKQNGVFDQKFNRQQENDFHHGGGTFSRGGYTFSGFQNKPTGYSTQYFEPVFRHDAPFDPGFRDYGYHAYESRPNDYGPPSFNYGPPTFSGGSYYGGPCFAPQFNGDMYSQPGPSAFQRGPVQGGPPGFQTGARRGGGRENFGQKPNYPFETFSDLKGNRPTFPRNEFKPDGGARVSSQGNYYNHGNTRKMGSSPVNREVDSPVFGASSGSGASLDSLDDFCPEHGTRSGLDKNVMEVNGEKVKSTVPDRGVGFEGLIGLSELGVPKGLFGDRVKNYYS